MNDRAVSEMVGFIIVIGLIISSISIVYFNGVPALQNEREAQKMSSMQTAFGLLHTNVEQIMDGSATSRGTEIRLAGDELEVVDEPVHWVNISVRRPDGKKLCPANVCNTSYNPIRFSTDENQLIYENGAVVRRREGDPSAMTKRPNWIHTNETLILPTVRTLGEEATSGTSTVSVFTEETSANTQVMRNESDLSVVVNVTTSKPIAWRTYGVEHGDVTVTQVDELRDQVTIRIDDVRKVIHAKKVIHVSFI